MLASATPSTRAVALVHGKDEHARGVYPVVQTRTRPRSVDELLLQCEREAAANRKDEAAHSCALVAWEELELATVMRSSTALFHFVYGG
jgi:hypothetical protein